MENIAASCSVRHPLLPVPRAYHVGPDLGLAGGNFEFAVVADFDDLEGLPGLPGQPGAPAVIGKAHPADNGTARRGPLLLDQNAPSAGFTIPGCRCRSEQRIAARGERAKAGVAAGRAYLAGAPPGRQAAAHRGRDRRGRRRAPHPARSHRWVVPGIVPQHAFHDVRTEPIPVRQPTWPGARTAFPSGRAGAMTDGRPVKTACGGCFPSGLAWIRSLGIAVQPLSCPASQPSRRDSGYPAVGTVQLPRSPRRRWSGCTAPRTGA